MSVGGPMRLTIWLLGREVFTVSTDRDEADDEADRSRDLSGGMLSSTEMHVGFVSTYLGETGMEGVE